MNGEKRYTIEEIKDGIATLPVMEAIVHMLNRPYDKEVESKAQFTLDSIMAGLEILPQVLEHGDGSVQARVPQCPNCESLEISIEGTDLPARKVKCFECGTTYEMNRENSIPASEAG